ncbi:hypothetical protein Glove_682g41 [Diversispora epigaea]|uniref:Brl1/Brr6 domain-containing protein n=1 Tax=Diversispora epigaea TaxID=1348612 RepID=A0A397G7A6_9GLOM|nr:hypothetical protein Glove_682g41 [Diversispora epigaea]
MANHLLELDQSINERKRNYEKGRCDPEIRVISSEVVFKEWELCMKQNSRTIGLFIFCEVFNEIVKNF